MKLGEFKIRKVSKMRKNAEYPSLTISEELKKLDIRPEDMVVVYVDKKERCVVIKKATKEDIERFLGGE